jgi:hypothetical protein
LVGFPVGDILNSLKNLLIENSIENIDQQHEKLLRYFNNISANCG